MGSQRASEWHWVKMGNDKLNSTLYCLVVLATNYTINTVTCRSTMPADWDSTHGQWGPVWLDEGSALDSEFHFERSTVNTDGLRQSCPKPNHGAYYRTRTHYAVLKRLFPHHSGEGHTLRTHLDTFNKQDGNRTANRDGAVFGQCCSIKCTPISENQTRAKVCCKWTTLKHLKHWFTFRPI